MSISGLRWLLYGAGGAAAYTQKDQIIDALQKSSGDVDVKPINTFGDNASKEIEELRKAILEQQKSQRVTVVHSGGRGTPLMVYPALALAGYLVYLRVVKGYKLIDLMYVSKAALQQSVGQVKGGIEKLKDQMDNAKKFLQKQMDQISELQKQLMSAQDNMGKQIQNVDQAVGETKDGVEKVSGAVRTLDDRMVNVAHSQRYTERGVNLLCRVVADLMRLNGANNQNTNMLTEFLQGSPPLRLEDQEQTTQNGNNNNNNSGLQGLDSMQSTPFRKSIAGRGNQ